MEKIETAKKSYYKVTGCILEDHHFPNIEEAMIAFAKLHVLKALKEASEKAHIQMDKHYLSCSVNKKSILNSYSLDNIK